LRKGVAVLAIALIGMLVAVVVEGVILVNFVFRIELSIRAAREAEIVKKINEVEFVKRGLDKTLIYSFHQASYFIGSRGGYSNFGSVPSYNCIPYWRVYDSTNYPTDFFENIEGDSLERLNSYTQSLSNGVSAPEYNKVERTMPEKVGNIEDAIKCSYYRCTKGCESPEVNNIEGCSEFCKDSGKICGDNAKEFPVEFSGTATISKEALNEINLHCIVPYDPSSGITWPSISFYTNILTVNRSVISNYGEEETCTVGATGFEAYKSLEITGDNLQIYSDSKTITIVPFIVYVTFEATTINYPIKPYYDMVIEATTSDELKFISETLEITDNVNMSKLIKTNILKLFDVGRENFVGQDKIGDAVESATDLHDCDDPKDDVISSINSKISSLRSTLNSQYSAENIGFTLSADDIQFDPSCNSTVAAKVLVRVRDTENKYPVYSDAAKTTRSRNIQLKFYVLSGNYVIQPIKNTCG